MLTSFYSLNSYSTCGVIPGSCHQQAKEIFLIDFQLPELYRPVCSFRKHVVEKREKAIRCIYHLLLRQCQADPRFRIVIEIYGIVPEFKGTVISFG